jgi:hypothetical protein
MASTNIPKKEQKRKKKYLFHGKALFDRSFQDASICFYQEKQKKKKTKQNKIGFSGYKL